MAIAFVTLGSASSSTTGTAAPGYPGSLAAGQLLVLNVASRDVAPSTPAGWTLQGTRSGGSGAETDDSGTVHSTIFTKESDGTESGAVTVTATGASVMTCRIGSLSKAADKTWGLASSSGVDSTGGTDISIAADADPGLTADDHLWIACAFNTDAHTFSNSLFTATGATFSGAAPIRINSSSTGGFDQRLSCASLNVASGTATAPPTYTLTASGSTADNPCGPGVFLRLREVSAVNVDPTFIDTAEALYAPTIVYNVDPSFIATAETFYSPFVDVTLEPTFVATAEQFYSLFLDRTLDPSFIATAEAIYAPTLYDASDSYATYVGSVEVVEYGSSVVVDYFSGVE